MMPNMMFGMATYMFLWLLLGTLVVLLLLGLCIWLVANWLKKQRMPLAQNMPQPQDAHEGYAQGYRAQQQSQATYQEDSQRYPYPQNEYPQTPYQEMEQVQHRAHNI